MKVSWVVLTMGDRPASLERCVNSIQAQSVGGQIIVVCNGASSGSAPAGTEAMVSVTNVGVPAGRNLGLAAATGEIVFFIDDDAYLIDPGTAEAVCLLFTRNSNLDAVSLRVQDARGETARRHVPRLGRTNPGRSSFVTTFLGGACALRADAFRAVGGYCDEFFYAHEESDLAWRIIDRGGEIFYRGDPAVVHEVQQYSEHRNISFLSARNRIWLARRRLPMPIAVIHGVLWTGISLLRSRSVAQVWAVLAGAREGLRSIAGDRAPMRWSTVVTMSKLGRPPII